MSYIHERGKILIQKNLIENGLRVLRKIQIKMIYLLTSENDKIEITENIAKTSRIWYHMLEEPEMGMEEDIELPTRIKTENVKKVLEFCEKYSETPFDKIPHLLDSTNLVEHGVPQWADDYVKGMDNQMLRQIVYCADYLDIQPLLQLCLAHMSTMILGKTKVEIEKLWEGVKPLPIY